MPLLAGASRRLLAQDGIVLLRRIALGLAVAALVVVAGLVLVAAAVERRPTATDPASATPGVLPRGESAAGEPMSGTRQGWATVRVGDLSYAVPPAWARRPAGERVAYREDGAVIAAGRGQALLSVDACPLAWAVLADPVTSSNVDGVAEATALAWARGYAGLPSEARLEASPAEATSVVAGASAERSRVEVDLAGASGCAGERAELTAVAVRSGAQVVTLVVARYLDVPGTPSDTAYQGMLRSFGAS